MLFATDSRSQVTDSLPQISDILFEFGSWFVSVDGGCQSPEIAYKSKLIISNLIEKIEMENIMEPKIVLTYSEQNGEICASTTKVYLRYVSNFHLYLHQEFPHIYYLEQYSVMVQRISK